MEVSGLTGELDLHSLQKTHAFAVVIGPAVRHSSGLSGLSGVQSSAPLALAAQGRGPRAESLAWRAKSLRSSEHVPPAHLKAQTAESGSGLLRGCRRRKKWDRSPGGGYSSPHTPSSGRAAQSKRPERYNRVQAVQSPTPAPCDRVALGPAGEETQHRRGAAFLSRLLHRQSHPASRPILSFSNGGRVFPSSL